MFVVCFGVEHAVYSTDTQVQIIVKSQWELKS